MPTMAESVNRNCWAIFYFQNIFFGITLFDSIGQTFCKPEKKMANYILSLESFNWDTAAFSESNVIKEGWGEGAILQM